MLQLDQCAAVQISIPLVQNTRRTRLSLISMLARPPRNAWQFRESSQFVYFPFDCCKLLFNVLQLSLESTLSGRIVD